ncbi:hypothetical protein SASPL_143449 [Salvia splendens]|uniref:Guanylate kinase 1 n=1 Tax=Salvia splendens TaxID=180675 RepID=A0A8X8WLM9_SALSN|nr:hypothetical protein SASPL_143449 [Salvia splendens]
MGCNRTFVIGAMGNGSDSSIGVRIFEKSTSEWVIPTVFGMRPMLSKGHSAIVLDEDRILVIKGNSTSDDCFWFLEVNTAFVREQRARLGSEVVAWSKGVVGEAQIPVVISGPSGVGKGTLIAKLMEDFPTMFGFSVSHTTRASRSNEQNGVHYHFTERDAMKKDIQDGKFLEFAAVHGNLYGTSVESVEVVTDQGKRCILDIDVQGARLVRASSLEAIFIFICPPSFEELEKRLRARGTETEEQIQKRLRNAKAEIDQGTSPGLFDHTLINDDLETCYENLKKLLGLSDGSAKATNISGEFIIPSTTRCLCNLLLVILNSEARFSAPETVHVPLEHTVSKINQKILINCITSHQEKPGSSMFVLDLSSIKGGAPGRTRRGLNFYAAGTNGFKAAS